MQIVSEERYRIASETERVAVQYSVPRTVLMDLGRLYFEAGQVDGINAYAVNLTSRINEDKCLQS